MYQLDSTLIRSIIQTLKELDVRGFDSYNRVVGLVGLFENILNTPDTPPKEEKKEE